jgi:hypothetical protein
VVIVENDPARVEAALVAGLFACPHCDGELRPWGSARARVLRMANGVGCHQPRRARCRSCRRTSVLLPDMALLRRVDAAAVIGAALLAHAEGVGQHRIAAVLVRPRETVRGWLQRFAARAADIASHFHRWALVSPSCRRTARRSRRRSTRSGAPGAPPAACSAPAPCGHGRRGSPAGGCSATRTGPTRHRAQRPTSSAERQSGAGEE